MRILLIEDDELISDAIAKYLKKESYKIDSVKTGEAGLTALDIEKFDAIILDITLPGKSGIEILTILRKRKITTPVLILTAQDSSNDVVTGLDAGADDYLAKPFNMEELCARLRALLRRQSGVTTPEIQYQDIKLNPASHQVYKASQEVELSSTEYTILENLLLKKGRVMTRDQLAKSLYGWDDNLDSNALDVHIHNLRKKLGKDFITTIRGVGYIVKDI